jgi:mannan endo-1,4-beta-mannosidase
MVATTENDTIPSRENLVNDRAAWLYFCPWYMDYLKSAQNNPVDNLIEIYNSDYCITLDELPDLKTYPISGGDVQTTTSVTVTTTSSATSTTTAAVTSSEGGYLAGDANEDGEVNMADAIAIMRSQADPDEYALSVQGKANADVWGGGDGITNNDALTIQQFEAGIVTSLPVE